MIEVWHPKWLKPTDGNIYVDRSHPSANAQGNPIRHYERIAPISTPQDMYRQDRLLNPTTDTAGKPYFSTTFFSQFTEGPRYGSNNYHTDPTKARYH